MKTLLELTSRTLAVLGISAIIFAASSAQSAKADIGVPGFCRTGGAGGLCIQGICFGTCSLFPTLQPGGSLACCV